MVHNPVDDLKRRDIELPSVIPDNTNTRDEPTSSVLFPHVSTCNCESRRTSNEPVLYEPDCTVLACTNKPLKNVTLSVVSTCTTITNRQHIRLVYSTPS